MSDLLRANKAPQEEQGTFGGRLSTNEMDETERTRINTELRATFQQVRVTVVQISCVTVV